MLPGSGNGSGGFVPTMLSGLVLWLRADKGITLNELAITAMASWTDIRRASLVAGQTDPFGGTAAVSLVEDNTAGNTHGAVNSPPGVISGLVSTCTIYAKAGTRTWCFLGDAVAGNGGAYFNLSTGAIGTLSGGATAVSAVSAGGGWFKLSVTVALPNSSISIFLATADNGAVYAGDSVSNIFAFQGIQSQPKVSAWADQSGLGHNVTQGTAANQPLWVASAQNGRPGVLFDGSNDAMSASGLGGLAQPTDVIAAWKYTGTFAANDSTVDGAAVNQLRFFRASDTSVIINAGASLNAGVVASTLNFRTWRLVFSGASSAIWQDGVSQVTGNAGAVAAGGVTLGGTAATFAGYTLGEIIIYNRALVAAEYSLVQAYQKTFWGTP